MKQTEAQKQAAFTELMREHGFQYLGATACNGSFMYERTWRRAAPALFYGDRESSFKIVAYISYGVPVIQLFDNGRAIGTRDYSSPKRAMNAIKEIIRCAGYAM